MQKGDLVTYNRVLTMKNRCILVTMYLIGTNAVLFSALPVIVSVVYHFNTVMSHTHYLDTAENWT